MPHVPVAAEKNIKSAAAVSTNLVINHEEIAV